jgi:hypothetical protein
MEFVPGQTLAERLKGKPPSGLASIRFDRRIDLGRRWHYSSPLPDKASGKASASSSSRQKGFALSRQSMTAGVVTIGDYPAVIDVTDRRFSGKNLTG